MEHKKPTDIKQFMNTNDLPFEPNSRSKEYIAVINKLEKKNKKITAILYFLKVICGITRAETMFVSTQKVTKLFHALYIHLCRKAVTDEYVPIFEKFFKQQNDRMTYVLKIIKENLILTEYYPFFCEIGYDSIFDYELKPDFDENDRYFYGIKERFDAWKPIHTAEIEAHMEKVQPLIDALESQAQRNKEKAIEEKKKHNEYRKSITAEIRQSKKYDAERDKRQRKLDREFERYYR